MKGKFLKVITVLVLLFTMTMSNFIVIGNSIISYALDNNSTNNNNVEFNAYFKTEEGEKVSSKDITTNNLEAKLYVHLSVKNDGYMGGTINLQDSNFVVKEFTNEYVNKVENNIITFNQINRNEEWEIEVPILFERKDNIGINDFNKESTIKLEAEYKDSSEKTVNIKSSKKVTLNVVSSVNSENILNELSVITNKIVKINGEEKRVLQLKLKNGINNNSYPMKKIETTVKIPKVGDGKVDTELKANMNDMNEWNYNLQSAEENIVTITMENERGKWNKSGCEEIILTCIYDKAAEINNNSIVANTKVQLLNDSEITAAQTEVVENGEEKDGVVEFETRIQDRDIYKGKLYSGIDREYTTKTDIKVNMKGVVEYIKVGEDTSLYKAEGISQDANSYLVETVVNKNNLFTILGENGKLVIRNENGEVIKEITNADEANQDGNIVVTYPKNTYKKVYFGTTAPQDKGNIEIRNKKVLTKTDREVLKQIAQLENKIIGEYNNKETIRIKNSQDTDEVYSKGTIVEKTDTVDLKDTVTEAELSIDKKSLTTLENNNVEISAILKSSSEKNDLFKNPKVSIILPNELSNIKINNINKVYADEMTITKSQIENVDGVGKVLTLEMAGESTEYLNDVSKGIQIIISADISIDKTTPSKTVNMKMKYTNENGAQEEYETGLDIDIVSKYGAMVYSKAYGFDDENTVLESTEQGKLEGRLNTDSEQRTISIERNIVNNYSNKLTQTSLIGKIKDEIGVTLDSITVDKEGTKIYYSESEEVEENSDSWKEQIENAKSYKIELPENTVNAGEVVKIITKLNVPEKIQKAGNVEEELKVAYNYNTTRAEESYKTLFTTKVDSSNVKPSEVKDSDGIGQIGISAISGGKELKNGNEIYEGQTVKNIIKITNNTGRDITNFKLRARQENAIFYGELKIDDIDYRTLEHRYVTRIGPDESLEYKEFEEEVIRQGETKTFEYEFMVAEKPGEETKGTLEVEADGIDTQETETMTNPIIDADLKLFIESGYNEEYQYKAGDLFSVKLNVENISEGALNNIDIEIPIPEGLTFDDKRKNDLESLNEGVQVVEKTNETLKIKLQNLEKDNSKSFIVIFDSKDFVNKLTKINTYFRASVNEKTYISNELEKEILQEKILLSVNMTSDVDEEILNSEDTVTYTAIIKNIGLEGGEVTIIDHLPSEFTSVNAYIIDDGNEEKIEVNERNEVETTKNINPNEELKLVVQAKLRKGIVDDTEISNYVGVSANKQYVQSNTITYKIKNKYVEYNENNNEEGGNGDSEGGNSGNGGSSSTKNSISGIAWLDNNKDGKIDGSESKISDAEIKIINNATGDYVKDENGNQLVAKTNENGRYVFNNLDNGEYIVLYEFDSTKYTVTEYKKNGVTEDKNSDVILAELDNRRIAATDKLQINNNNQEYINIGLVENQIFDLRLDKYISKIIVQDSSSTRAIEYNNAKLAKVELDSKKVNGTSLIVEYEIVVTNEGEIPGYANEIVDYMPSEFKFNSELNADWYNTENDGKIHSVALSKTIINPGESKKVKLTLIKAMSQENLGTVVNTAEIQNSSNELMIQDKDSTAGNKASNEDDISSSELIVSIRTGAPYIIGAIIALIGVLSIVAIYIVRRRGKNE